MRTRPYRLLVAERVCDIADSIRNVTGHPLILIAGDFNDYSQDASIKLITDHDIKEVSAKVSGRHGARGTYRFQGEWGSLDHVFCNASLAEQLNDCRINDAPFLLEKDKKYGGVKPFRTFLGPRYLGGFSDHLPLVVTFLINDSGKL